MTSLQRRERSRDEEKRFETRSPHSPRMALTLDAPPPDEDVGALRVQQQHVGARLDQVVEGDAVQVVGEEPAERERGGERGEMSDTIERKRGK
ncbi:hypothetical protein ACHAWF_002913 [Thalassiosira exigua]